jgi:TPR repeat protein
MRLRGKSPITLLVSIALLASGVAARAQVAQDQDASEASAGVWTDQETGLMWTKKDNGSDVTWQQAADFCRNLQLASHSDWRLPALDELQRVYDSNVNVPGQCCGGKDATLHVKGNMQPSGWEWSNWKESISLENGAWAFSFTMASTLHSRTDLSHFHRAMCVRQTGATQGPSLGINQQAITLYRQGRYSEASPLLDQACKIGSPEACRDLGYMYANGDGVEIDSRRAVDLFSEACNAGYANGCTALAYRCEAGDGVAKDEHRAFALYFKACSAGDGAGCNSLGIKYQDGVGVKKNLSQAATYFSKACDAGESTACAVLGDMYEKGDGVQMDSSRAGTYFLKACDAGEGATCWPLAYMYLDGEGFPKSASRAELSFLNDCNGGDKRACEVLSAFDQSGNVVSMNYSRANALFAKGCDSGTALFCSALGWSYRNGWGVNQDIEKAKELLRKGCAMKDYWGCGQLKKIP